MSWCRWYVTDCRPFRTPETTCVIGHGWDRATGREANSRELAGEMLRFVFYEMEGIIERAERPAREVFLSSRCSPTWNTRPAAFRIATLEHVGSGCIGRIWALLLPECRCNNTIELARFSSGLQRMHAANSPGADDAYINGDYAALHPGRVARSQRHLRRIEPNGRCYRHLVLSYLAQYPHSRRARHRSDRTQRESFSLACLLVRIMAASGLNP